MIPVLLKSTDAGAPSLANSNGSLNALLKWALPQLGWTVEFDSADGTTTAFKPAITASKTGGYLQIIHGGANAVYGGPWGAYIRYFQTMTDEVTGTEPVPLNVATNTGGIWITDDPTALDTVMPGWFILGDGRFFYIGIQQRVGNGDWGYGVYFAGEYNSVNPASTQNFVLGGNGIASTPSYSGSSGNSPLMEVDSASSTYIIRPGFVKGLDGDQEPLYLTTQVLNSFEPGTETVNPYFGEGLLPVFLKDGPHIRGCLPGLFAPHYDWSTIRGTAPVMEELMLSLNGIGKNVLRVKHNRALGWNNTSMVSFWAYDHLSDWEGWPS